jgi:hypothetical protein
MIYVKTPAPSPASPRWATARRWAAWLTAALLASAALAQSDTETPQHLQAITLTAGMYNIRAEVAITPEQRQKGLMFRRDLAQHEGMLFVFEEPAPQCFWMHNTPTPLSIAFLADDGRIVNLADMKPFDDSSHCSAKPVRFVLEMNQGWFAKRGLKPGFKLTGAPFQP